MSAGPENNECLPAFGNGGMACLDSALSQQGDSASWSPITTLDNEGLNQPFVNEVPISMKQSKSRNLTSHATLAQWWNDLIPRLIPPFSRRVAETNWDSQMPFNAHLLACNGDKGCYTRTLKITCIHLKSIREIPLTVCNCRPAALLLLELGLFPSAPVYPMLAVDLDLLDFTSTVFKDTLRRHFRKALQYYNILVSSMEEVVNNAVVLVRKQNQENAYLLHQVQSDHATSTVPAVSSRLPSMPLSSSTRPQSSSLRPSSSHHSSSIPSLSSSQLPLPTLSPDRQSPQIPILVHITQTQKTIRRLQTTLALVYTPSTTAQHASGESNTRRMASHAYLLLVMDALPNETSAMSEYYTETKAAAKSAADKRPPNIRERGMAVINDVID
ncbi:hypothetical protein BS47DRAFT_1401793 [Hydnum rufescens UP504]|uniref:CxC1-like cysteine cluster associated with KDZ transposases domain-containing protein n=1 Tax=Hydnum rufescens UP504 TaxID=1448309 RepID=A0A9P6DMF8_9AGAM|nr:hypothetical protein BS47DRAFT_1401793 [Hydnum rufescens UP504]